MAHAEAWFLYEGEGDTVGEPAELVRESIDVPPPGPLEAHVAPLYGAWEGNMGHAVSRRPTDVCRARREQRVVLGNGGVVRVLEVGSEVTQVKPGQAALLTSAANLDEFGYHKLIHGFDAPGTVGLLATRINLPETSLAPLPADTRHSLQQWAAFGCRYTAAWSNWRLAFGTFRLQVSAGQLPAPNVWGWGGGTTLAELDLARREGCNVVMLSGTDSHIATIERTGVTAVDRRAFGDLTFDDRRFVTDAEYRRAYSRAERAFLEEVRNRTDGRLVQIFVDYIGTPVFRATLKALGREGVLTTAGWRDGMSMGFLRAHECILRRQHIHTHYASHDEVKDAVEYGERTGWMPQIDDDVTPYDEIPELSRRFLVGEVPVFPIYSVNPE
ncbi:MAG: zinc-binding alcohol dehydrogenase family protein [Planctomycetota bacterium]